MRVALLDVNCKYSSTGKIVYDLYSSLNQEDHTAAVFYGRGKEVVGPNIHKFSSDTEVYAHALLTRITGLTGYFSYFATRRLIRLLEEFQPDVVHLHELHGYYVNIGPVLSYLKKHKIKTIWTFHCEFMYTGKCGQAYDCEKWQGKCGNCPQLVEYPSSILLDFTSAMLKMKKKWLHDFSNLHIVTPSLWLAERVRQSFLSSKDITVVYNGIDTTNVFYPRDFSTIRERHQIRKEERVVLAVAPGLMSERKGGRWVTALAERFNGENVRFIMIGVDGDTSSLGDNIVALPRTKDNHLLAQYYSMADITLMVSKKETFSLVCAESLACGTPVLGFDAGGPTEVVPYEFGRFVPHSKLEDLETLLRKYCQQELSLDSGDGCAIFAQKNYSLERMYQQYLSLYASGS